ncbi:hypothetical protein QVD17_11458 [Tagetes erecta]|uniref:IMS import disulfide relay-system CHCH-CHCH-like Cx9C domain-containing protein n=1 Tax=Tagetes erecta TaxID=13708 RepID=A0AAD8KZL4_TARER|nr:hypothetical protein QVD17_11458 [Tagetes erecta]
MKERATSSPLKRILANCGAQAKDYGSCVAAKVPQIERDMCLKEFIALKNCMQNVVLIAYLRENHKLTTFSFTSISELHIYLHIHNKCYFSR